MREKDAVRSEDLQLLKQEIEDLKANKENVGI